MESDEAIPISKARLCLNCDNIIQSGICPVCLSTKQLFLIQFLGSIKKDDLKRFVTDENGKIKMINIQPEVNGKGDVQKNEKGEDRGGRTAGDDFNKT